jgi:hypothetical protein
MNKAEQVLQYFGQYKPTKLRLIPTWKWGLHRIQINEHIVDFRFVDGCNPTYAIQLAIDEIRESISGSCILNTITLEKADCLGETELSEREVSRV